MSKIGLEVLYDLEYSQFLRYTPFTCFVQQPCNCNHLALVPKLLTIFWPNSQYAYILGQNISTRIDLEKVEYQSLFWAQKLELVLTFEKWTISTIIIIFVSKICSYISSSTGKKGIKQGVWRSCVQILSMKHKKTLFFWLLWHWKLRDLQPECHFWNYSQ